MQTIRWILTIRNKLLFISLSLRLTWLQFSSRRAKMRRSEFLIYGSVILFLGISLGMVWHARQIEPGPKVKIVPPVFDLDKAIFNPGKRSFSPVTIGMKQD